MAGHRNSDSRLVLSYLESEGAFPAVTASIRAHLDQNPDCTCELWMPRTGGVSSLSDLAPDCTICGIATFWGSGKWEENYDDHPDILALFSYLKHRHPREDGSDPDDYWAYICDCCWNREIPRFN